MDDSKVKESRQAHQTKDPTIVVFVRRWEKSPWNACPFLPRGDAERRAGWSSWLSRALTCKSERPHVGNGESRVVRHDNRRAGNREYLPGAPARKPPKGSFGGSGAFGGAFPARIDCCGRDDFSRLSYRSTAPTSQAIPSERRTGSAKRVKDRQRTTGRAVNRCTGDAKSDLWQVQACERRPLQCMSLLSWGGSTDGSRGRGLGCRFLQCEFTEPGVGGLAGLKRAVTSRRDDREVPPAFRSSP